MSKQRRKGTLMETRTVDYLREAFEDDERTIDRAALHGSNDVGDITGLFIDGEKVVVEVKNCRKYEPKEWLKQAEAERGNADAAYGIVVFHINGVGLDDMGEQGVLMKLRDFCKMRGGNVGID